ncbi:hypothetical protein FRC00_009848 [Tulasnella sp. 408]|nr:hypothetical protein FRC00_009848 [Tulasnella sp. 408]
MPPKRTNCPFHQKGNCRKGDRCNMLHIGPAGGDAQQQQPNPATRSGQANSNRPANQATSQTAPNSTPDAGNVSTAGMPPNACKAFWTTGQCESAFSCKYRHVKAGASAREQDPIPPPRAALNNDDVGDVSNPYTSALPGAALTPTQAHNRIKLYLKPDYDFRRSEDYYTFASILQSANPQNNTWFIKDGQRFKPTAYADNLTALVHNLAQWLEEWGNAICSPSRGFADDIVRLPVDSRKHTITQLKKSMKPLVDLVERSEATTRRVQPEPKRPARMDPASRQRGLLLQMHVTYQPPGELREGGPQHENDHASIKDIRIVPPHSELVSTAYPYLPGNIAGAPHHLPSESMERLLDIQFRLLREELMYVRRLHSPGKALTLATALPSEPRLAQSWTTSQNLLPRRPS